jgi:hypothetical protein
MQLCVCVQFDLIKDVRGGEEVVPTRWRDIEGPARERVVWRWRFQAGWLRALFELRDRAWDSWRCVLVINKWLVEGLGEDEWWAEVCARGGQVRRVVRRPATTCRCARAVHETVKTQTSWPLLSIFTLTLNLFLRMPNYTIGDCFENIYEVLSKSPCATTSTTSSSHIIPCTRQHTTARQTTTPSTSITCHPPNPTSTLIP